MAISLGIYPIFRQTHIVSHRYVWKWRIPPPNRRSRVFFVIHHAVDWFPAHQSTWVSTQTRATQAIPRITNTALKHTRNLGSGRRHRVAVPFPITKLRNPKIIRSSLSSSHSSELYQYAETTPGSKASVWGSHHYYKNEPGDWCLMVLKSQATPKWNHDYSSSASWVFAMLLIELIELFIIII